MFELAWFVAGVVLALVVSRPWSKHRSIAAVASEPALPSVPALASARLPPGSALTLEPPPIAAETRQLALSLAGDLANLASGVEGRAQQLIEAAPGRVQLPQAAEALLAAVQRLRTLHSKLVAFGNVRRHVGDAGSTALPALIARLGGELQQLQLGLELRWDPPPHLPEVAIAPDVAHDALLFLCGALLRAERGATLLSIESEPCFASDEPHVQLELALEWIAEPPPPSTEPVAEPSFTLDLEAASQLISRHGGDLVITHLPGRSVRAVVRWPVAPRLANAGTSPTAAVANDAPAAAHRYGGALVLESDPSVRAMLASELKASGRAVFACADSTSARTFLEATPDRFELLIVDHPQRLDGGEALAATIRALVPELKIFVLTPPRQAPGDAWPRLHHIEKPFGVHELRRALASVLAAG